MALIQYLTAVEFENGALQTPTDRGLPTEDAVREAVELYRNHAGAQVTPTIHEEQIMDLAQISNGRDAPPTVRHIDDIEWETIRWPGETGKMLFHPRPENPTEPNAGLLRFEKGSHHPWHRHDFAQIWYVLEGEFTVGGRTHGPGTMFFHGDPHCEEELHTETGGLMVIVQYPGPTTGGRPIYDKRFNMEQRRVVAEERTDI